MVKRIITTVLLLVSLCTLVGCRLVDTSNTYAYIELSQSKYLEVSAEIIVARMSSREEGGVDLYCISNDETVILENAEMLFAYPENTEESVVERLDAAQICEAENPQEFYEGKLAEFIEIYTPEQDQ